MAFEIGSVILFFIYSWGFGYLLTKFVTAADNFIERNIMRIGLGVGLWVTLGVIFSLIHIPLNWWLFLILALAAPLYDLIQSKGNVEFTGFRINKRNIYAILAIVIFLGSLFVYTSGAFKYEYLEDDDPWTHSTSIKYVATERTISSPESGFEFKYLGPYPPAYQIVMGVLHQTTASLSWTMKVFNALLISFSILFFYFFAREFMQSSEKALLATFVLASVPAFLTHFIWAFTIAMFFFFAALYALEMTRKDKRWAYVAGLLIAGVLLSQPTMAIKAGIMFILYFIGRAILDRKFDKNIFIAGASGILLSLLWWGVAARELFTRTILRAEARQAITTDATFIERFLIVFNPTGGTATRAYNFSDYFFAQTSGLINNAVGIGFAVMILLIIALIFIIVKYKQYFVKEKPWVTVSLFWLLFTFISMNTETFNLPIGLDAFRSWMLFAIPVALLSAEGAMVLSRAFKSFGIKPWQILLVIVLAVLMTSTYQKVSINTSIWPPGQGWSGQEELQGYLWLKSLPEDTSVFTLIWTGKITGMDKYSCEWCPEVMLLREQLGETTAPQLYAELKKLGYEYIVIDASQAQKLEPEYANLIANSLVTSELFEVAHRNAEFVALKLL